jgi:hypothetical protein
MFRVFTTSFFLCFLLVGGVILSACSPSSSNESPVSTPTLSPQVQSSVATPSSAPLAVPSKIPKPEEGKASVGGVLYTFSGHGPIPETIFYLTPAQGGANQPPRVLVGPREEKGDIQGKSNTEGQITLNNVPAGNYYLAVWAPYNWLLAVESAGDQTPRLIELGPNESKNLGVINVAWP